MSTKDRVCETGLGLGADRGLGFDSWPMHDLFFFVLLLVAFLFTSDVLLLHNNTKTNIYIVNVIINSWAGQKRN